MSQRQTGRLRGPYAVAAFVLLTTIGVVAGYLVLRQHPTPTDIVDIVNLDGDSAVVVRQVRGPDERSFLSVFDRERGERWGALIPAHGTAANPASSHVAATGKVIFVRTLASGQPALFAFGRDRGQKLGRIEPLAAKRGPSTTGYELSRVGSLAADGHAFELFGQPGQWTSAFGFDLEDGTLMWEQDLGALSIQRAWLRSRHLILYSRSAKMDQANGPSDNGDATRAADGDIILVERTTGNIAARMATRGAPCVVQDTLFHAGPNGHLHAVELADPLASSEIAVEPIQLAGLCGRTRTGHLILAIRGDRDPDTGPALLALTRGDDQGAGAAKSWAESWRLRLPVPGPGPESGWYLDQVAVHTPDRTPLANQLTRFVPVLLGAPERLVMIDTHLGKTAWYSPALSSLHTAYLMTGDGLHYLYMPERATLAVFDGHTGNLASARDMPDFAPVYPRQIAANRIWVFSKARWAVVDATTLQPMPSAGLKRVGTDARERVSRELGGASGSVD